MALSMMANIDWNDIHEVKLLKDMKVFLLIGLTGDRLVIKVDSVASPQIKDANRIAKVIDRTARVKILAPSELIALKSFVATYMELVAFYDSLGMTNVPFLKSDKATMDQLDEQLRNMDKYPEPFVKMDAMRLQNIDAALQERGQGNKGIVRDIATSLKADGGLEKLGQIVAMDMFNDNTDRFYPDYNTDKKIGPFTILCKVCVNPGNVMLAAQSDGTLNVTALDFIDPNSQMKTYGSDAAAHLPKGLQAISVKASRKEFAEHIVHDLESFLHPRRSKYSLKTKLGRGAAARLDKGIVQGSAAIKVFLKTKYPGGLPGALAARVAKMP
jgi:hypothetical protein